MEGCSIFSGVVYYIIILTPHCFTKYADLLWVVVRVGTILRNGTERNGTE